MSDPVPVGGLFEAHLTVSDLGGEEPRSMPRR
jgi:hypothetical protein